MQLKALGDLDLAYTPVTPCRIVDTRPGAPAAARRDRAADRLRWLYRASFAAQGGAASNCDVPSGSERARDDGHGGHAADLGFIKLWPANATEPNASDGELRPGDDSTSRPARSCRSMAQTRTASTPRARQAVDSSSTSSVTSTRSTRRGVGTDRPDGPDRCQRARPVPPARRAPPARPAARVRRRGARTVSQGPHGSDGSAGFAGPAGSDGRDRAPRVRMAARC